MIRIVTVTTFISLLFISSCKTDNGEALYPNKIECDTTNVTYSGTIAPIIQANCTDRGCHTSAHPDGSKIFETYNGVKIVVPNDQLMNALQYKNSPIDNMPPAPYDKLSDCDIAKFEAWIRRGYPNN